LKNRKRGVRHPAVATHPAGWWPHLWKLALLWALVLAAYSNARAHEANLPNIQRILTEGYWVNQPTADLYRPLTTLSYLLNYAILGNGTNPAGYHGVNLILHAANVSLVYALGILIFDGLTYDGPALGLALAAIWGLHPLLTEGVTNIVGRADLLAALGILVGLLCHIRATAGGRMAQGRLADRADSLSDDCIVFEREWRRFAGPDAVV
jgi:protein O-mannosyl-transferase